MDPRRNPFAPGAGTRPPELAGREAIIENARIALARVKAGRPARSQLLLGLRGVGKTVLLNEIARHAETDGYRVVELEAPESRRLAEMLVPPLRSVLNRLSSIERARATATRAMRALQGFVSAFRLKIGDMEVGVSEPGIADSGHLETDLPALLLIVAEAAAEAEVPVAILVDEIQYLSAEDLSALIVSVHRVGQRGLPLVVFGAGLPQLAALAGEAKSYAERLFEYPEVGPLAPADAARAIREPIRDEGAEIEPDALDAIVRETRGYPYFLQEWGAHAWNAAAASPITLGDVARAGDLVRAALDTGFFRVRLDRLTVRERDYVRAMAELGPGPHRSGEIAALLGIPVQTAAPLRAGLIDKGMIYSPQHGDTAFTVPTFDEYLRRAIPDWTPPGTPKPQRRR